MEDRKPASVGQRIRWSPSVREPVEGVVTEIATWDEPKGVVPGKVMLISTDEGRSISVPANSHDWELVRS